MLSKIRFWPLVFACACRLGTPRPDGAEGPTASAPSGVTSPSTSVGAAPSSLAPSPLAPSSVPPSASAAHALSPEPSSKPVVLTLPGQEEASAAAPATPPAPVPGASLTRRSHRIAVLGDSLSDPRAGGGGYLLVIDRGCPGARVENLAKGGFMVNQMRRRFEAQLLPRLRADFDDLIVFGGVNDLYSDETAGRTFAKISADLGLIYRGAKARGVRVIALTVTPWGGFNRYYNPRRAAATQQLNAWIKEQQQLGLVDIVVDANPLLACGDSERLCAELSLPFRDGLHFGKLGHQRLGEALLRQAFADCRGAAESPADGPATPAR